MRTKDQINQEIRAIENVIAPMLSRISELKKERLIVMSPFKIGDRITWVRGNRTSVGTVRTLQESYGDNVKLEVSPKLKSGADGQLVTVFNFDNPKLA